MHLYLIRHGIAAEPEEYDTDSERPLTKEGERKTRKIAQRLYELEIQFDLILTSPLLRAQQTAQILQTVGLSSKIEESATLAPSGDIGNWLEWYKQWQEIGSRSLALVGHQPDLGSLGRKFALGSIARCPDSQESRDHRLNRPRNRLPSGPQPNVLANCAQVFAPLETANRPDINRTRQPS